MTNIIIGKGHPVTVYACSGHAEGALVVCMDPSGRMEDFYEKVKEFAEQANLTYCIHWLPGCGPYRRVSEMSSYEACREEIRETIVRIKEQVPAPGAKEYLCIMADGLAARLVAEAEEASPLGADRLILLSPAMKPGSGEFPEITGKMDINGRVAKRCGKVPVGMGKDDVMVSDKWFSALRSSDPMQDIGNIRTETVIAACGGDDRDELESLASQFPKACIMPGTIDPESPGTLKTMASRMAKICLGADPMGKEVPALDKEKAFASMEMDHSIPQQETGGRAIGE